jgi:hypothetical protein
MYSSGWNKITYFVGSVAAVAFRDPGDSPSIGFSPTNNFDRT